MYFWRRWVLLLCFRCATVPYWLMQFGGRGCEGFDASHKSRSSPESAPGRLWMDRTEVPSSDLWPVLCLKRRPAGNEQVLLSWVKNALCPQSRWSWNTPHWICCYWRTYRPQVLESSPVFVFSNKIMCSSHGSYFPSGWCPWLRSMEEWSPSQGLWTTVNTHWAQCSLWFPTMSVFLLHWEPS